MPVISCKLHIYWSFSVNVIFFSADQCRPAKVLDNVMFMFTNRYQCFSICRRDNIRAAFKMYNLAKYAFILNATLFIGRSD